MAHEFTQDDLIEFANILHSRSNGGAPEGLACTVIVHPPSLPPGDVVMLAVGTALRPEELAFVLRGLAETAETSAKAAGKLEAEMNAAVGGKGE